MKTSQLLPLSLAPILLPCASMQAQNNNEEKMNIVVILADDLGWGDVGFHGSEIKTPNIDKMAQDGIVMDRFYTAPVSSPTRAGFLTGRYPNRFSLRETVIPPWRDFGLDTEEETLADMLGKAGYSNRAILGKWHLGHSRREYYPLERGFTHFYGHLNGAIDYFTHMREGQLDWHNDWDTSYDEGYSTDLITDKAVECINEYSKDGPFFLYVAFNAPHGPLAAKSDDIALYTNDFASLTPAQQKRTTYSAMVTCLDRGIGEIRKALKKAGIEDNTMLVFFSDNGGEPGDAASNSPLRGNKYQEWDGGVRVPAIVSYPAKWTGGRTISQVAGFVDIMPTIRGMLNIQGEPHRPFDGVDISSLLSGETQTMKRDFYLGCGAIVNNDYKLIQKGKNNQIDFTQNYFLSYYPENSYESKNFWTAADNNIHKTEIDRLKVLLEQYDGIESPFVLPPYAEGQDEFSAPFEWDVDYYGKTYEFPYAVSSYADFMVMRNNLDKEFYLTDNITIPENTEWIPIGAATSTDGDPKQFRGTLDGRGHTIKDLSIAKTTNVKGLFGRMFNAKVRNVDLENVDIKGGISVGGISGAMLGGSKIERVSVSGKIEGESEVGGIVGRVARDGTYTYYNTIHDSYVSANIKATSLSTNAESPSCAGGIAALTHSPSGSSVAKIDIQRAYFSGSVESAQMSNVSGSAAGILSFYDNNQFVKMNEVLVLADQIKASTPNYFFSRGGVAANELALLKKLYTRDDITLNYYNNNDKGTGASIADGIVHNLPLNTYKTADFYKNNLSWDFENVWYIDEGSLPKLRRDVDYTPTEPEPEIIYVSPSGTGSGSSWADAANFSTAAQLARDFESHQIWLKAGTYSFTSSLNFDNLFVYGGFVGTETKLNQRNWHSNPTILDGNNQVSPLRNRITVTDIPIPCVLDGVIVQNGTNPTAENGGGMITNDGTIIRNCIFRNNQTRNGKNGGAIHCHVGTTTIENCLFINNTSAANGGAIQIGGGVTKSILINCTFANNKSVGLGGAIGAGANSSNCTLINTVIYNNSSSNGTGYNSYAQNSDINAGGKIISIHSAVESTSTKFTDDDDINHLALDRSISPEFLAPSQLVGKVTTPSDIEAVNSSSYALAEGSRCINAGRNDDATSILLDLAGTTRIQGASVDIGAYEFAINTSLNPNTYSQIITFVSNNQLYISGAEKGKQLFLFDIKGSLIHSQKIEDDDTYISIRLKQRGIYFAKIDEKVVKVVY